MHTNTGITAEVPGSSPHHLPQVAGYLLGKNPFEREKIYNDLKRGLRHTDRTAMSSIDVALHGGGIAHRHLIAAIRNTNYYEPGLVNPKVKTNKPPIMPSEYTDELENIDSDGCVKIPDGPGLGVELDWDWIRSNTVDTIVF